jgi:hypothetical protein
MSIDWTLPQLLAYAGHLLGSASKRSDTRKQTLAVVERTARRMAQVVNGVKSGTCVGGKIIKVSSDTNRS